MKINNALIGRVSYYLLQDIFGVLSKYSKENYIVGGAPRDLILNRTPKDWDIVTDVPIDKLISSFQEAGWKVNKTGIAFLVLSISKRGRQFEIANFRKDGQYTDGRHPETVEVGTINEDAKRRDFTVNAIYLKCVIDNNTFLSYNVVDPTGLGLDDIKGRRLRFIGKPKDRIREDYLRVFRFYRFLTKGFQPDPKSLRACRELFNEAYPMITPERVRAELEKISKL